MPATVTRVHNFEFLQYLTNSNYCNSIETKIWYLHPTFDYSCNWYKLITKPRSTSATTHQACSKQVSTYALIFAAAICPPSAVAMRNTHFCTCPPDWASLTPTSKITRCCAFLNFGDSTLKPFIVAGWDFDSSEAFKLIFFDFALEMAI